MHRGDLVIIFTPDDTHAEIALEAIHARLHVLIAKPAVKTLNEHLGLIDAARERGVLVRSALDAHACAISDSIDGLR
jgi:D-galacturonate reductase